MSLLHGFCRFMCIVFHKYTSTFNSKIDLIGYWSSWLQSDSSTYSTQDSFLGSSPHAEIAVNCKRQIIFAVLVIFNIIDKHSNLIKAHEADLDQSRFIYTTILLKH